MKYIATLLIIFVALNSFAQESSVSEKEASKLVNILAHPALAGRGTGQPGFHLAGELIAMKLHEYGIYPLYQLNNQYFHDFTFQQVIPSKETSLKILGVKGYEYGKDFVSLDASEAVIEGPVVFAGFGITAEEYQYDDYADINAEGAVVVIFRHEPHEQIDDSEYFEGRQITEHSYFTTKIHRAVENGAAALIIVEDVLNHIGSNGPIKVGNTSRVISPIHDREISTFPVLSVSMAVANEILGMDIMDLQNDIEQDRNPRSFSRENVTLRISAREELIDHRSRNVLGYFIGSERDEYILIGAHYDHLGVREDGIFFGADDNASGTAGVLAVAEALRNGKRWRRNIIFGFWGAEEWGLIGSQVFAADQVIPIDQIKAVINLDMIGRNEIDVVTAIGAADYTEFSEKNQRIYQLLNEENALLSSSFKIHYEDNHDMFFRTDSASFFFASPPDDRIPTLFLTSGGHGDYHRVTDTVEKLNTQKIANISELAYRILVRLANDKELPRYE